MIKIPSAESLMLDIPNDILEDLLARKIVEAKIARLNKVIVEGAQWTGNKALITMLKEKGYEIDLTSSKLTIIW